MPFNRLDHNILGTIRPRLRLSTSLTQEEVFAHLKEQVSTSTEVSGQVTSHYAILKIPAKDAHYWSPELQIRIDDDEFTEQSETTILKCLIGPRQAVWGLFAACYGFIALVTFFGGMYGLVELSMGKESPFVWLLLGLALIPCIWWAARVGQRTGRDQMLHLVSVLYHTLDAHGTVERVE